MLFKRRYITPEGLDDLIMISDGKKLTGLIFAGSENACKTSLPRDETSLLTQDETSLPIFDASREWLDEYFGGRIPSFTPEFDISSLTPFQQRVAALTLEIPYGKTATYGEIADIIAAERGITKMSSRAVGGAVGKNPICIIIPCHRVLGANGAITGYGGGISNKIALLDIEKIPYRL